MSKKKVAENKIMQVGGSKLWCVFKEPCLLNHYTKDIFTKNVAGYINIIWRPEAYTFFFPRVGSGCTLVRDGR